MGYAARAIIIENDQILVMHRNKHGSQYYTLPGGQLQEGETSEQALVREIFEETGLKVVAARLVFTETYDAPYNSQDIFLCKVAEHANVAIDEASEEAAMNRMGGNVHAPLWAGLAGFASLPLRTPGLHSAILKALKKGFPKEPIAI